MVTASSVVRTVGSCAILIVGSWAPSAMANAFALYGSHAEIPFVDTWGLVQFETPLTGVSTRVGMDGLMYDFDLGPSGEFYTSDGDDLFTLDKETGVLDEIGAFPISGTVASLAFSPDGTLYGRTTSSVIYTIDPVTLEMTEIGHPGVSIFGMDFGPDGTLFGTHGGEVYTVDTITGERIETVAQAPIVFRGLDYGADGVLRGVGSDGEGGSALYEIDPLAGTSILIGQTTENAMVGLGSIPEPATLVLLLAGTVAWRRLPRRG